MDEIDLTMFPRGAGPTNAPAAATERPLRICVVFDDDRSAQNAEVLIRHVTSDYACDTRSFRFDELDRPAAVVAAARSASDADILLLTVRDNQMLPSHVKSWLGLCIGLRDDGQGGAIVALIDEAAQEFNSRSSLLDYLGALAVIGRMEFFPRPRGIGDRVNPSRNRLKLEDSLCGSSS